MFLEQFSKYFTTEEQESELYQLWSSIGVNMEKALLEEQTAINNKMIDINAFSEDTLRSWLAFFMKKIPYRTSATSQVSVSLVSGKNYKSIEIPKYAQLISDSGIVYTQLESISLSEGDERKITCVQGKLITEQGTYGNIIKFQAVNPDLSYLKVYVNGVEIPEVTFQSSFDDLKFIGSWTPDNDGNHDYGGTPFLQNAYGNKGEFYTVLGPGYCKFSENGLPIQFKTGDVVVYDGNQWNKLLATSGLRPIQNTNSYAIPMNGYYAYYYGGYLYIKIFKGTEVSDPYQQPFKVEYISSDGAQGEIKKSTLSYVSSYQDSDDTTVELNVTNTQSSSGSNAPTVGKLGLMLKERLYSSINISSVPEYTAWFKAQPEVGDCMVLSDWERYIRSGKTRLDITQIVEVYAIDNNGKEISDEVMSELFDRISPFKDIAVIEKASLTKVESVLQFEYISSTSNEAFESYVKSTASQYYNLSYLQSKNKSLFENLDLSAVMKDIQDNSPYDSEGLILKAYHYLKIDKEDISNLNFSVTSYDDESIGTGYYIVHYIEDKKDKTMKFVELESNYDGTACNIATDDNTRTIVGNRTENEIAFNLSDRYEGMQINYIECYWGMKNEGILSIGASNGLRSLHEINITKVTQ